MPSATTEIIDMQLHEPGPFLSWAAADPETRRDVLTEALCATIDAVGVDGAVLHPVEDVEWALSLASSDPDRFRVVLMVAGADFVGKSAAWNDSIVNRAAPDIEERIHVLAQLPGVAGMRFLAKPRSFPKEAEAMARGEYDRAFHACQAEGLTAFLLLSGVPWVAGQVAARFPDLQIVLDHIGLLQPPNDRLERPPWELLPEVLKLAEYPNIAVKLCGAPALSEQGYPFDDVRPHIERLVDRFSPSRLAWASDISRFRGRIGFSMAPASLTARATRGDHTYRESLALFLDCDFLSPGDKGAILGGTTRAVLQWPPR